jgi:hypothetical protein
MALRFIGQSPVSATSAYSAVPGRTVGTVSGVTLQTSMQPLWGARRNQTAAFGELAGQPDGTTHPSSWLMALQAGRISSRSTQITFSAAASGTLGLPATGSTSITFTVPPADLQLVVSASGSTSITFSTTGSLAGALAAQGAASFSFTVPSATLGAIINAQGNAPITWSLSATPRAIGVLSGDITPFTELSPQSLSAAVWEALASAYNTPGSMGELLNSAGGGASPATIAAEVWSTPLETLTAEEIMRVLLAALAGARSGLGSGTEEYLAQDGTTPRITFSPDAQGNGTPIIDAT